MDKYLIKISETQNDTSLASTSSFENADHDYGFENAVHEYGFEMDENIYEHEVVIETDSFEKSEKENEQDTHKRSKRKWKKYIPSSIEKLANEYSWIDSTKKFVFCKVCSLKLAGGRFHLNRHSNSITHINNICLAKTTVNIDKFLKKKLTNTDLQIKEAELKMCCYMCEHNLSFLLIDTLPLLNKNIYPDSLIASGVNMKRKKVTGLIVEVLAPYFKKQILLDLRKNNFSIIIDETTDVGTKKCLALVVRYWNEGTVKDRFLELLEIKQCTAEAIFNCIREFFDSNNIPLKNIIGLAADNASTMMGHLSGVQKRFRDIVPHIYVQGCTCHSLHLCTSSAAKKLPNTVEQFTRDIYSYFSNSNKRQEELQECQVFFNERPHKMLYPSQTRWLSLIAVVDRILGHWESLKLFFSRAVANDNLPQAKSVLNALNNPIYRLYLLFLSYILKLVTDLNVELQSEKPKIPILLSRVIALYNTILKCFIKKDNRSKFNKVQEINIHNPSNYVLIENLYIGAKSDIFLMQNLDKIPKEDLHSFRVHVLSFFIELANQIKQRFNFEDQHLKYAANFCVKTAMSGEIKSIAVFSILFPDIDLDVEAVNTEWQMLSETDLGISNNDSCSLDFFWEKVSKAKNSLDEFMFPNLIKVVKIILSLPHSSATAERVFSELNLIKTSIRNKLLVKTCSAILNVKDAMKLVKGGSVSWRASREALNYNESTYKNYLDENI
ncbi:unnamed protein product [Psylliodes chrysocephalus]|uniref:Uncharacterized protein n=1 Tax=Psylliodes chrysocephalus TaxID=3402493 RepID=A0A9P0G2L7_9CUCU|nr:unnamed protein product [Psylliodes chrysocephala]